MKTEPDEWLIQVRHSIKTLEELANNENWKKQLSHSIKTIERLNEYLEEKIELKDLPNLPIRITPYYLKLIKENPVLQKTVVPSLKELETSENESQDPLCEDRYKKTECIIHKYPNRVLFTVTKQCASYCRYCTRSRMVGDKANFRQKDWEEALDYIRDNNIKDVLISGGDGLMLTNSQLTYILDKIVNISSVDIIRIGSKVPIVLPYRIDSELISILRDYNQIKPVYINLHVTHPAEITSDFIESCKKLSIDAGCILGSQTVILKDINDDAIILQELFHKLLKNRVRPYYAYQMDKINGGSHFRVDIEKFINLQKELISFNSGLEVPDFILDSEIGKIPLRTDFVVKEGEKYILNSFEKNKSIFY